MDPWIVWSVNHGAWDRVVSESWDVGLCRRLAMGMGLGEQSTIALGIVRSSNR